MNNNSILIVDDQLERQCSLKNFLENNLSEYTLDSSYLFRSTREEIIRSKYNLVLLDMTMPSSDSKTRSDFASDGKGRVLAGSDVIQTMHHRMTDTPVIIATQFDVFGRHNQLISIEEITSELFPSYPSIVKDLVLWDYQSDNWNNILLNLMNGCLK